MNGQRGYQSRVRRGASNDLEIRLKKLEGKKNALAPELVGSVDAYNADYLR